MKKDIENIDENTKNIIIKAFTDNFYNIFNIKLSKKELWGLITSLNKEVKPRSKNIILGLLSYAKEDLEASKLLYEKGTYTLAVYHIQQCIEKLTKAIGLSSGLIREEDLYYKKSSERKDVINHKTPKTFVLILKNRFSTKYMNFLLTSIKVYGNQYNIENFKQGLKKLEKLINNPRELSRLSKKEIIDIIKVGCKYQNILEEVLKTREFNNTIKKFYIGFKTRLEQNLDPNIIIKLDLKRIEGFFITISRLFILYPLSIITFPHFTCTRYPDGDLSLSDYNENLGIVSTLKVILRIAEKNISYFENLFIEKI